MRVRRFAQEEMGREGKNEGEGKKIIWMDHPSGFPQKLNKHFIDHEVGHDLLSEKVNF